MRQLKCVIDNSDAIKYVAGAADLWGHDACGEVLAFCNRFLLKYSSFPTNTQFIERGVKDSGYVSLGRRNETSRSVMITACGGTM
eukprot:11392279-Ditylum_brightwellii.AAC.1